MAIEAIRSAFNAYAQKSVSGATAQTSSASAAAQEAAETQATTVREAQTGDKTAQRKLLKLQAAAQQLQPAAPRASEPGKGTGVDHVA